MKDSHTFRNLLVLVALTLAAILVHGYHLGIEDQSIYLPAIEKNIQPGLFPHDAYWFEAQTQWTVFDELVALSAQVTRLPIEWVVFLWHFLSWFLVLYGCWALARRCFSEAAAQWAAVTAVVALLTLPVAETRLLIADQYLHPRALATAFLLFALPAVLDRRWVRAALWMALSVLLHPQMAAFSLFHLAFQAWRPMRPSEGASVPAAAMALPLWQTSPAWQEVLQTREHYFVLRWAWYSWLGILAPIGLLLWFSHLGRRDNAPVLRHVSARLALACAVGTLGALIINVVPALARLAPAQPMRQLHFVFLLLFLFAGGLLGKYVLRNRAWRWALLFVPLCGLMFYVQSRTFPASAHLEWPGAKPRNEWLQAFEWIRQNTPEDALFALDPRQMSRPGADFHAFRPFARRSILLEYFKDYGKSAIFPELASSARERMQDLDGWQGFQADDYRRLKAKYGVNWVLVERPGVEGLPCPYANARLAVCRVE